jgi:hypothetical protein
MPVLSLSKRHAKRLIAGMARSYGKEPCYCLPVDL